MQLSEALGGSRPLDLSKLELPQALRIVVLAPHPDDFDAIGVSMRLLHQCGHEIHLAVATTGASGVENGWNGATTPEEKTALREAEQRASCRFFGLPVERLTFLRLWDNDDPADDERLRAYLLARRPDLVFLPHGNDTNATHRRTYESLRAIAERDRLSLWACLNRDAKTVAMRNDLYMYFGEDDAAWKGELLRFHRSQHERNLRTRRQGFDERVLAVNRTAAEGRAPYAEVFELERFGA